MYLLRTKALRSINTHPDKTDRLAGMSEPQIESDWPKMRLIWDFLRSVLVHFYAQRTENLSLKRPSFINFGTNLAQFRTNSVTPVS